MLLWCDFFIKCLEEFIAKSTASGDYIDENFYFSFIFFNILLQSHSEVFFLQKFYLFLPRNFYILFSFSNHYALIHWSMHSFHKVKKVDQGPKVVWVYGTTSSLQEALQKFEKTHNHCLTSNFELIIFPIIPIILHWLGFILIIKGL